MSSSDGWRWWGEEVDEIPKILKNFPNVCLFLLCCVFVRCREGLGKLFLLADLALFFDQYRCPGARKAA